MIRPHHSLISHLPTILIVTHPNSEYKDSYSSSEDLNLIRQTPLSKVIFNVGLVFFAINVILSLLILIFSIAKYGSSTFVPQIDLH